MSKALGIVIFRNDLRLHDNPVLTSALQQCARLLPVFIWDPRFFGEDKATWHFKFPRCHGRQKRFLLESIGDLKARLQSKQSDLILLQGDPLRVLRDQVLPLYKGDDVRLFMSAEYTYEENILVHQLRRHVPDVPLRVIHTSTMVPPHKLPCRIQEMPDVFSQFRTMVEKARRFDSAVVAPPVPEPTQLKPLPSQLPSSVDSILDGLETLPRQPAKSAFPWKGGETAALERMHSYFYGGNVRTYKQTRNGLVGTEYSTKFSPWLARGCLSARQIMHDLARYEDAKGGNESTYWVWFELLWRDYLKFVAMKFGNRLFFEGGIYDKQLEWHNDMAKFRKWCEGKTGVPFVDANMRELAATGWMSNRGRQNVASFLVRDLKIDWRLGAEWFESLLLDHDPASNYGNWLYVAGLGNDPREDRYFNMIKQAKDYDPHGEFVLQWLPELRGAVKNQALVHTPWLDPESTYPAPITKGRGWTTHSARKGDSHKANGNKNEKSKGYRSGRHGFTKSAREPGQAPITSFFTAT
ncbi:hypothetical protein P43SY_011355 [Pythium insidiosum]|uniref:Cryptochrome DASH n=1 Tax=Pythium insidiosum TaxID=114742 RepID=A0AAD5LLV5_PYTIN|nr:hypothetical protein P43SY_011355 [Pythium insidiosum]